jgi:hypothetical protein
VMCTVDERRDASVPLVIGVVRPEHVEKHIVLCFINYTKATPSPPTKLPTFIYGSQSEPIRTNISYHEKKKNVSETGMEE